MGIYESIEGTDEMGSMIVKKSSEDELIAEAKKSSFINMYQDGFIKALNGTTSIEEIIRVTQE